MCPFAMLPNWTSGWAVHLAVALLMDWSNWMDGPDLQFNQSTRGNKFCCLEKKGKNESKSFWDYFSSIISYAQKCCMYIINIDKHKCYIPVLAKDKYHHSSCKAPLWLEISLLLWPSLDSEKKFSAIESRLKQEWIPMSVLQTS